MPKSSRFPRPIRPAAQALAGQAGQGLVEFALLLPVLLLILLGAIDLGRAFNAYVTITNASREGARYGASQPTNTSGIQAHVIQEAALSGVTITTTDITIDCAAFGTTSFSSANCSTINKGDQIRVTVTNNFQFLSLYLFRISGFVMSNFAIMPIIKT